MSRRHRSQQESSSTATVDHGKIRRTWAAIWGACLALAIAVIYMLPGRPRSEPFSPGPSSGAPETRTAAPADDTPLDPQKLVGKWQRLDGGYVLEVKRVADDGAVEAAYFNPRPINVGKAQLDRSARPARLTVELRDEGYPGSTYKLTYDRGRDQLHGTYFQPASNQMFRVDFVRMQ